ncbi:hypothetical protein SCA6_016465 [Theobroma cacao]
MVCNITEVTSYTTNTNQSPLSNRSSEKGRERRSRLEFRDFRVSQLGAFIKTFYWPLIVCFTSGRPLQGNCLPHVDMPLTVSKFNEVTPWENEEKGAPKVPADKGRNGTSITLTMAPTSARQKKLWW